MAGRVCRSRRRVTQLLASSLMLVWALATAVPVAAQGTGGMIAGTVKDAQGGVLPGVSLTVRNVDTGVTRTIVTEGDGTYRFAGLQPGTTT